MTSRSDKKRVGCLALTLRLLVIAAVGLGLLLLSGAVYEATARASDLQGQAPPGQLVEANGLKLHLFCLGEAVAGQPTVLLEAGAGGWSIHWYAFQREVAAFARVCAYDRAGFGWSAPGPQPRDGQRIAAELHALLTAAGEPGPYILVGASRGGQYVRLYQAAYPTEVVGLVLVDAEPEDFRAQDPVAQQATGQNQVIFSVMGALNRFGVLRLMGGDPASAPEVPCLPFLVKTLPVEEHTAYLAVEGQPQCFEALLGEEAASDQREAQVRQLPPLGDLPLVVLTHGQAAPMPGVPPEQAAATEATWQTLQQKLATLSTRGTLVQATESGHNIANDQPALVLEALRSMLK